MFDVLRLIYQSERECVCAPQDGRNVARNAKITYTEKEAVKVAFNGC
jgi:hypothetical protein